MDISKLSSVLAGEPSYRFKQAHRALWQDFVGDWEEVTSLPLNLRERLNAECPLRIQGEIASSKDSRTKKALITLSDGVKIETVLLRHKDGRNTLCVSAQAGCPLACVFCATGQGGFKRNLSADEILCQYLFFARYLKNSGHKVTNVVFMGMGEPFLNYDNLMAAIKTMNDPGFIGLGARHISVSTVGITDGIRRFAREGIQANLAISLHAPDDKLRAELMPIGRKYPIKNILAAADYYIEKTSRRVMFEYMLIKGVNDSPVQAGRLAALLKKPLYIVNLINYNPTGGFEPAPAAAVKKFRGVLEKEGIAATERYGFGGDIDGACGQLAGGK